MPSNPSGKGSSFADPSVAIAIEQGNQELAIETGRVLWMAPAGPPSIHFELEVLNTSGEAEILAIASCPDVPSEDGAVVP